MRNWLRYRCRLVVSDFSTLRNLDNAFSGRRLISSSPAKTGLFLLHKEHFSYSYYSSTSLKCCLCGAAEMDPLIIRLFCAAMYYCFSSLVMKPRIFCCNLCLIRFIRTSCLSSGLKSFILGLVSATLRSSSSLSCATVLLRYGYLVLADIAADLSLIF